MLAQITARHFCCGLVLESDRVTVAAPIVGYMRGWSRERVRGYCAEKGWRVAVVRERP